MRVQRCCIGAAVALAVLLIAVLPVGAASVTLTPSTVPYGGTDVLKVTGLKPNAAYTVQIYNPFWVPLIPGGLPFVAGTDGTVSIPNLNPDQTDQAGVYTFEIDTADGRLVGQTTGTLVGTNTYYIGHRLGS